MKTQPPIEPLESRIAPAVVVAVNGLSATYTDVDGDLVTLKASKPILDDAVFTSVPVGLGEQLQLIDLSGVDPALVKGVNLTITAKPQDPNPDDGDTTKHGDGLVNVGHLKATGRDLGAVSISGDLGQITAGSGSTLVPAVKSLSVGSMGEYGPSTGGIATSAITGTLASLTIKGNLRGIQIDTLAAGNIGPVTIGGSLIGVDDFGSLNSAGNMGPLKIGGDLIGDSGIFKNSGTVESGGTLASVTVGGRVSGLIASLGAMGPVKIVGDLAGVGAMSGTISSGATMGSVSIGGSVDGRGGGTQVHAVDRIGSVVIGHNLLGGDSDDSGQIIAGAIGNVTIGGSIIGGAGHKSGRIEGTDAMGAVKVGRNIEGGPGDLSGSIFAPTSLVSLNVGGSIIGNLDTAPMTGFASASTEAGTIGTIKIGGNLIGGFGAGSGRINTSSGRTAVVAIGGSIVGGNGNGSGVIDAKSVGAFKVGHDILGGAGVGSAGLSFDALDSMAIGGSVIGGSGEQSVQVSMLGHLVALTVGGSVIGGGGNFSGQISASTIDNLRIGHDLLGGGGDSSGHVSANIIKSAIIGGSIVGGNDTHLGNGIPDAQDSGRLVATLLGAVKIGGSVIGGNAPVSGAVFGFAGIGSLSIAGSLVGGPAFTGEFRPSGSGFVYSDGSIGPVLIGGDIRGSDGFGNTTDDTGSIQVGRIASLTVGGSIIGGTGAVVRSGAITANFDIGPIVVKGDIVNILISATSQETPTAKSDIALKSLTVGGRVDNVAIELGYDKNQQGKSADAQLGSVKVGGDWIASFIIAGVNPIDGQIGDNNDTKSLGAGIRDNALNSKIASIVIGGQVLGKPGANILYGFAAEQIGSFKYNGVNVPLAPGVSDDTFAGSHAKPLGPTLSATNADGFAVHVFEV